MEKIGIIGTSAETAGKFLEQTMDNVKTYQFLNVQQFASRVQASPLRIDTLIMLDTGISSSSSMESIRDGAEIFKRTIINNELFELGRVLYLNTEANENHRKVMKLFEEYKDVARKGITFKVFVYPSYPLEMVKTLLTKSEASFINEVEYSLVIRKERDMDLQSRTLERFETDKTVIVEHSVANTEIDKIKDQMSELYGDRVIPTVDSNINKELIEEPEVPPEPPIPEVIKKCKIVGVLGESKSGTSTAAMILGATAARYGKTLILDLNYGNLGLSYLAEKTLIDSEINLIDLRKDILESTEGIKVLREKTFNAKRLHILANSLPVVEEYSNEDYSFMLSNIVESIKTSYDYIIMDIPVSEMDQYGALINNLDKLVLTSPPYMNNIVSLLTEVGQSQLKQTNIFSRIEGNMLLTDVALLRTRVFAKVNREIKAVNKETIDKYSMALINRTLHVTGVYTYQAKSYLDTQLFAQLIGTPDLERGEVNVR